MAEALELEETEFSKNVILTAENVRGQVQGLERELAPKGSALSGVRYVRELEIRFDATFAGVLQSAIERRTQLGKTLPELLSVQALQELQEKLHRHVDSIAQGALARAQDDAIRPGLLPQAAGIVRLVAAKSQELAANLKSRIAQELRILRLESSIGLHSEEKPMTLNISHSAIANLNLGTVVGDLTASVQTLNNHGQAELADTIKTLAEALAKSSELRADQQKELLEHLSFVSTEVALPPDQRKMGPLRSSISALRSGLENLATLAALWQPVEQILKSAGLLPAS